MLDVHGEALVWAGDDNAATRFRDPNELRGVALPLQGEIGPEGAVTDDRADVLDHTEGIDHVETVVREGQPHRVTREESVGIVARFGPEP